MTQSRFLPVVLSLLAIAVPAMAQLGPTYSEVDRYTVPDTDLKKVRLNDEARVRQGRVPHYAVAHPVQIDPWDHGGWDTVGNTARWRLRVFSRGALSINLAFGSYHMPEGGRLVLRSLVDGVPVGPFTERDNEPTSDGAPGPLWTPPLPGDELLLEVTVPLERLEDLVLDLEKVHHGYAGFGEAPPKAGACHRDVVCSEGEAWSEPIRSVGLISVDGTRFCTGFLVNNTALDGRPFFVTAAHCGITRANAASVVVMWGYQRAACGEDSVQDPRWVTERFQSGAIFRAAYRPTDTVLVELDDLPDPAFEVFYAGWNRRDGDPDGVIAIHHPNTDYKSISRDEDRALTTWHLRAEPNAQGNHLRVGSWESGTTEGGSSGAPLFDRDQRVVGQLHGGWAACGDRRADWFGRFSVAWDGAGRPGTRLKDWLDPIGSEALVLDGMEGESLSRP